jgi:hypothetical protein
MKTQVNTTQRKKQSINDQQKLGKDLMLKRLMAMK